MRCIAEMEISVDYQSHTHEFPPVWDGNSKILILGSFPSVKSREQGFFYGHPRNRFWNVLAAVLGCTEPQTIEEKKKMLLTNGIALWDVIASCEIRGSSDSSIRNVEPNDFSKILEQSEIQAIFANGQTAGKLYHKYVEERTGICAVTLPSTSPANAAWSLNQLVDSYEKELKKWL